jgi:hypothetical protein
VKFSVQNSTFCHDLSTGVRHAETYAGLGIIGMFLSVLLIYAIYQKIYKYFIPWICFQIIIIGYPIYFSIELARLSSEEIHRSMDGSAYSQYTWLFLMIFIFHTIFEGYYLCLIIGLSQVVANLTVNKKEKYSTEVVSKKVVLISPPCNETV